MNEPYKRKTIATYVDMPKEKYRLFQALARLRDMSAAKLLGQLAEQYVEEYWTEQQPANK